MLRVRALALLLVLWVTAGEPWVVLWSTWNLTSELLKSLALGLWNQKSGEDTEEHEERENLENVVEPWRWVGSCWVAADTERCDGGLSDDRSDLTSSGGETVRGRSVTSWETLARNDECGGVGTWK